MHLAIEFHHLSAERHPDDLAVRVEQLRVEFLDGSLALEFLEDLRLDRGVFVPESKTGDGAAAEVPDLPAEQASVGRVHPDVARVLMTYHGHGDRERHICREGVLG